MLKMILKDLRLSPLRSILTSVSMLVGIIAMLAVVAVAVSVLTALLGGLLPALKAAKLEPALALR